MSQSGPSAASSRSASGASGSSSVASSTRSLAPSTVANGSDDRLAKRQLPRPHLAEQLDARSARVELGVVLAERPRVRRTVVRLGIATFAGEDAPERFRVELLRQLLERRDHPFEGHLRRHGTRSLGQDRAGVEVLVHQMHREPEIRIVLPHRPGERKRPSVAREQRRVAVHHTERRNRQDLGREQPRVPGAETDLRLVRPGESQQARLVGGEADVELFGRVGEDHVATLLRLAVARCARRDHRDRRDPNRVCELREVRDRREDGRVDDGAHDAMVGANGQRGASVVWTMPGFQPDICSTASRSSRCRSRGGASGGRPRPFARPTSAPARARGPRRRDVSRPGTRRAARRPRSPR